MITHFGPAPDVWATPSTPASVATQAPRQDDEAEHQIRIVIVRTHVLAVTCTCRKLKRPRGHSPVAHLQPIAVGITDLDEAWEHFHAFHDRAPDAATARSQEVARDLSSLAVEILTTEGEG